MNQPFLTTLVTLFVLIPSQVSAVTLQGVVVGVSDGDTITVLDAEHVQSKIRLSGIDAPEKKQPFGQASKQALSELVYDKQVVVDWNKKDRYGRIVGKVLINRMDVNLEQIKQGLAWHYTKYQKEQSSEDRLTYVQAETAARSRMLGLWSNPNPVPPWDWRHTPKDQR